MWHHWCQHWHHVMTIVSSKAALHSLGQCDWNVVQHDFFGDMMPLAPAWYHMMPVGLSMAHLHSLGQDNQNEVQYDFFGHVMPLALSSASHDTNGFVNCTTAFLRSRKLKWVVIWHFGYVMSLVLALASCDADVIVNGTITFLRSGWSRDATWLLIMWHYRTPCQCHMKQMASYMAPLPSLGCDNQNEVQHDVLVILCHWHQC